MRGKKSILCLMAKTKAEWQLLLLSYGIEAGHRPMCSTCALPVCVCCALCLVENVTKCSIIGWASPRVFLPAPTVHAVYAIINSIFVSVSHTYTRTPNGEQAAQSLRRQMFGPEKWPKLTLFLGSDCCQDLSLMTI